MDKYIGRSRLTAANSYYEPSYLYSSAKDTSFSRYHPSLQASPLKLHLEATSIVNQAALNTYLQRSQNQETALRTELDHRRILDSQRRLTLADQINLSSNLLAVEREKQQVLTADLASTELQITELIKKKEARMKKELEQLQGLDIRAGDVNRQVRDIQFRMDAHQAMILGLERMAATGN